MKLIDLTCPKCNGTLHVEEGQTQVYCSHCGTLLLLDNEVQRVEQHVTYDNAEDAGYQFERGRKRAQAEAEQAARQNMITPSDQAFIQENMHQCPSCGSWVGNSKAKCPYCGKRQKKKTRRVVGYVLLGVALWFIIASVVNYSRLHANDPAVTPRIVTAEPRQTGTPAPEETPEESPVKNVLTVGDTGTAKDVSITLKEVKTKTADDKEIVICHFLIENNSEKDMAVSSLMSFSAYIDDFAADYALATVYTDLKQLDGEIAAGKKMDGAVCYSAEKGWSEIEITFVPSLASSQKVKFVAEHP